MQTALLAWASAAQQAHPDHRLAGGVHVWIVDDPDVAVRVVAWGVEQRARVKIVSNHPAAALGHAYHFI